MSYKVQPRKWPEDHILFETHIKENYFLPYTDTDSPYEIGLCLQTESKGSVFLLGTEPWLLHKEDNA